VQPNGTSGIKIRNVTLDGIAADAKMFANGMEGKSISPSKNCQCPFS
jgi:hypothetical protein